MKNRVATIGLVAFLAVDVGLVALALRPNRAPSEPPSTIPVSTPTTVTGSGTSPTGTGTSTASATTGTAAAGAVPVGLLVSALDGQTAWRVKSGTCSSGGSAVELTTDSGKTWNTLKPPARAVSRVQVLDSKRAFLIGAGADCNLKQFTTADAGDSWQAPTNVSNGWARQLDAPTEVLAPRDEHAKPCDTEAVVDLSRTSSTQAEALCASGDVKVTTDGGTTWSDSGSAPGAVALSNFLDGDVLTTYAVRVVSACDGLQVVKVVKGRNATVVTCVRTATPKKGDVGLWVSADAGWILNGGETWTADGGLRTWQKA
ncbi:hypothetical protein GCM10027053_33510 [Intrasporangium mesophilum]